MKILLTGGNGFFSSRFLARYDKSYSIACLSKQELNVCDRKAVLGAFEHLRPDIVIHSGGLTSTDFCNTYPQLAREVNIDGSYNIAEACAKFRAKLIFMSTEQVFNGNAQDGPYDENVSPVPNTVYGQTKLEAENAILSVTDNVWIIRLAWMFGMPQRGCGMSPNILWQTIRTILNNEPIYASPNEYRSFTYVEDVLNNTIKVLDTPCGIYHFAAVNNVSRYEFVKHIFNEMGISGRAGELLLCDDNTYKAQPRDARLSAAKAARYGLCFDDAITALSKCIIDYSIDR